MEVEDPKPDNGAGPWLQIEHLKKSFGPDMVLRDINLEVAKAEVVVILGPSGCGKSTFLRCLAGLEEINGGKILFQGEAISDGKSKGMHKKIGMVFQSYDLFDHLTVLRNITLAPMKVLGLGRQEAEDEAITLLERFGLADKKDMYQRQLSGGQRQRVAIIRALCMHPEVMLLDEITAALDPEMVHEVLELVLELANHGLTMIIVTHEMDFARAIADRVVFLDQGTIMEITPTEQFFRSPETDRAKEFLKGLSFAPKHRQ